MHIISSPQINTLYSLHRNAHYILFQEITLYPHHRNTLILFSDKHNKSSADKHNTSFSHIYTVYLLSSQTDTLYPLFRYTNYIVFTLYTHMFSEKHTIVSWRKCILYPLHRITQYNLFSENHIISPSQINTINHSPQINTICPFTEKTFSDRHTISSFQIYKLYPLHRNTHILFSDRHTISTSQKYTLYTVLRNAHYILFSDKHTISSSQKYTLFPLHRNTHYIFFSEKHIISSSHKYTLYPLFR